MLEQGIWGINENRKINRIINADEAIEPIIAPSQLFLGDIVGAILCLPNNIPAK
jgi:hypothetical protein